MGGDGVGVGQDGAGALLASHARALEAAGAEAVMICANLMHKVAPAVEAAIDVPLIHIGDAVAAAAGKMGQLGVMGARWTMQDPFYADRLALHGINVVPASQADVDLTDRLVFDELTLGIVRDESRTALLGVVDRLADAGAQGVVLACTELPLILSPGDATVPQRRLSADELARMPKPRPGLSERSERVPLINSADAHIAAAVDFILGDQGSTD